MALAISPLLVRFPTLPFVSGQGHRVLLLRMAAQELAENRCTASPLERRACIVNLVPISVLVLSLAWWQLPQFEDQEVVPTHLRPGQGFYVTVHIDIVRLVKVPARRDCLGERIRAVAGSKVINGGSTGLRPSRQFPGVATRERVAADARDDIICGPAGPIESPVLDSRRACCPAPH